MVEGTVTEPTVPLVRLNLGCGVVYNESCVNVDSDPSIHADLHVDARRLPFVADSVTEIIACHLIEHFNFPEYRSVLAYWAMLLKPGGEMLLSFPDVYEITKLLASRDIDPEFWSRQCFAWVVEDLPYVHPPSEPAWMYHRCEEAAEIALDVLSKSDDAADFVGRFRRRFNVTHVPPQFSWVHKSAHSLATMQADLEGMGMKVQKTQLDHGMYSALWSVKI